MKILACGPYIGDFEQEITTFRPYCRWLQEIIDHDVMYISSHSNRSFMYDFIQEENFIPVYENLSREEPDQIGYINKQIIQRDYNFLIKSLKDDIVSREGCNKGDILHYHLNYVKSTPSYPIYNKIFEKIVYPDVDINICDKSVVLIPHKSETEKKIGFIYEYLRDNHNCLIIGDMDTHFQYINRILRYVDLFENGWKYIFSYIESVKAIICPISHWTAICNLQNLPVFSWGEGVGQYKEGGIYYFGNKNSTIIPTDEDTEPEVIIRSLKYFLEGL